MFMSKEVSFGQYKALIYSSKQQIAKEEMNALVPIEGINKKYVTLCPKYA